MSTTGAARPLINIRPAPQELPKDKALSEKPKVSEPEVRSEAPKEKAQQPRLPEGPLKRNKFLKDIEPDVFQPRYQLLCGLPEIPIRPKLFKYRLNAEKTAKYEFTTVELNQKHEILVDYNMGMRVDLVDRGVYESIGSSWRYASKEN